MSATPQSVRRWTAEDARALQDESRPWPRYECIGGELLVSPGPRPAHYDVQMALYELLRAYVAEQGIGRAFVPPTDVTLEPGTTVQPDVYVVPGSPTMRLRAWSEIRRLLLAVEVFSPSTARHDRLTKRRFFARTGVPEYWIADVDARLVERCLPDGRSEVLGEDLVWQPEGARAPFVLDLVAFFEEALGPEGDEAAGGPAAPG